MSDEQDEQDEQREVKVLLKKLTTTYQDFKNNHTTKPAISTADLINTIRAASFKDQNTKAVDALLHHEPDVIHLSVSPKELIRILHGLNIQGQYLEAEHYVKGSVGTNVSSEQRWSKVAEIMLIKEPGEKLSRHNSDVFCWYWGIVKAGRSPREASEEVFKRFKFSNQEACDQWLKREVNKRKKEGGIYADIPAPSTSPRN